MITYDLTTAQGMMDFNREVYESLIKNPKLINCIFCWEKDYSDCGGYIP